MGQQVTAEVALYPLRTDHLSAPINAFIAELASADLVVESGQMSAFVRGDAKELFAALARAFSAAAAEYQVVMRLTVSNACPSST